MKKLLLLLLCVPLIGMGQQTLNESITHDNLQRDYIIHIPSSYSVNTPIPLVFCFHGYGSDASTIMSYTNFNYISDTAGFIVVYPQGTLDNSGISHWNVGWGGSTVDDIGFTEALMDNLSATYNIDNNRIYSTGMSNGGFMSYQLACQLSNRIAAIASVTGSMTPQTYNACNPQHPTPILQIHGTSDQTVPFLGDPTWTKSIEDVLQYWVAYNNCNTSAVITAIADINIFDGSTAEHIVYDGGDNYITTEHFKIYGGDHDWPGVWGNMDIHASAEVWKFFSGYDINGLISTSTSINDKTIKEKRIVKI
ncbi:MAG: alpha/beta hydrolase family esterase, partial [Flavobacteriales bacterium]